MRFSALPWTLLLLPPLFACGPVADNGTFPDEADPQQEEVQRLQREIVRLQRELLDWKLRSLEGEPRTRVLLEEALSSPFGEIQLLAVSHLSALPESERKTIAPFLAASLPRLKEEARVDALLLLGRIDHPEAEGAVCAAIGDEAAPVRIAAAAALKRFSPERAVPPLHTLLTDPEPRVQIAALDALGTLRSSSSAPRIVPLLTTSTDPVLLEKVVTTLGAVGDSSVIPPLLVLLKTAPTDGIRWAIVYALGNIGRSSPEILSAILPLLQAEPIHLREVAMESLGKLRARETVLQILPFLEHPEPRLRSASFTALVAMQDDLLLKETLLPVFVREKNSDVSRLQWTALSSTSHENVEWTALLADFLLQREGTDVYLEELASRLHEFEQAGKNPDRCVERIERIAIAEEQAGAHRLALDHYRRLSTRLPERWDFVQGAARCHVRLKEFESARKLLLSAAEKTGRDSKPWWTLQRDLVSTLEALGNPPEIIETTWSLLTNSPSTVPEELRPELRASHERACRTLLAGLDHPDTREAAQKESIRLGRKLLGPLLILFEDPAFSARIPLLTPIANAITGTRFDPEPLASSAAERRKAVQAWEDWRGKP